MNVGDLIAPYVGLQNGEKALVDAIHKSSNGVTTFRLSIPNAQNEYTVHLVREDGETSESLQATAAVAGFYNAKYFHEMVKYEKMEMSTGKYKDALKIEDEGKQYPVFITERQGADITPQHTLTLDQLSQVARELSKLHAFCFLETDAEAKQTLNENHVIISAFHAEKFAVELADNLKALTTEHAKFFSNAAKLPEAVNALYKSADDLTYISALPEEMRQPSVLCHGELSAEKIIFGGNGKLVEIRHWDNVHYGSVAEDLSFLIITSASTDIRRNHYLSVFRQYYYRLVDLASTKFKLAALKESFKKMHKYAVLASMDLLLMTLRSQQSDEEKMEHAQRWESALEDAVSIENNEYLSDNEDAFFAK
uniref:CHK domain-containing protein n=1 Tax=Ascaris lumbricoides TaxID=6252 RepID=A0A0M3HW38_ASCLU